MEPLGLHITVLSNGFILCTSHPHPPNPENIQNIQKEESTAQFKVWSSSDELNFTSLFFAK